LLKNFSAEVVVRLLIIGFLLVGTCPSVFAVACETFTNSIPGPYSCTVSAGVTSLNFEVKGGNGGDGGGNGGLTVQGFGGQGAKVTGSLTVTPGSTLYITIGGNGGQYDPTAGTGGGGGGYSAIATTSYTGVPLVIAGGGGGGGWRTPVTSRSDRGLMSRPI